MVTKNEGGEEEHSNSGSVCHCGDRGLFAVWTCRFSAKLNISVSGCYSFISIGNVSTKRWSAANFFFFLYIGADVFISWIGAVITERTFLPRSKRKQKYWVLHRNGTFKFKITPDRHNAGQKLIYCLLSDPPHFSLPSTFKQTISRFPYHLLPVFCCDIGLKKA
jgi:hypothetical protein